MLQQSWSHGSSGEPQAQPLLPDPQPKVLMRGHQPHPHLACPACLPAPRGVRTPRHIGMLRSWGSGSVACPQPMPRVSTSFKTCVKDDVR